MKSDQAAGTVTAGLSVCPCAIPPPRCSALTDDGDTKTKKSLTNNFLNVRSTPEMDWLALT